MDLSGFYGLMSATCFTLVGLWWLVVERHPDWKVDQRTRRLAGGTYLSFLLPGVMSLFAQVNPDVPLLWRVSFGTAAVVGIVSNLQLMMGPRGSGGLFTRNRWVAVAVYAVVLALGAFPELASSMAAPPLTVGAFLLVLLVVLAHGLTWEFMMRPEPDGSAIDHAHHGSADG